MEHRVVSLQCFRTAARQSNLSSLPSKADSLHRAWINERPLRLARAADYHRQGHFETRLAECDLENTYFRSPFWLDIGIRQTAADREIIGMQVTTSPTLTYDLVVAGRCRNETATVCIGSKVHWKNTSGS
jgi:hypothetical protein